MGHFEKIHQIRIKCYNTQTPRWRYLPSVVLFEEKLNKTHFSLKCNFRCKLSLKNDPKVKKKLGHVYKKTHFNF